VKLSDVSLGVKLAANKQNTYTLDTFVQYGTGLNMFRRAPEVLHSQMGGPKKGPGGKGGYANPKPQNPKTLKPKTLKP
jgi:hypothetical protein